jgi:hypothetical protein
MEKGSGVQKIGDPVICRGSDYLSALHMLWDRVCVVSDLRELDALQNIQICASGLPDLYYGCHLLPDSLVSSPRLNAHFSNRAFLYLCSRCQHLTDSVQGDTNTPLRGYRHLVPVNLPRTYQHSFLHAVPRTLIQRQWHHATRFSATDTCDTRIPSPASLRPIVKECLSPTVNLSQIVKIIMRSSRFTSYLYYITGILYMQAKCSVHPQLLKKNTTHCLILMNS